MTLASQPDLVRACIRTESQPPEIDAQMLRSLMFLLVSLVLVCTSLVGVWGPNIHD